MEQSFDTTQLDVYEKSDPNLTDDYGDKGKEVKKTRYNGIK